MGIITKRDDLCINFTREKMWKVVKEYGETPARELRKRFNLPKDNDWSSSAALNDIKSSGPHKGLVRSILYAPFDWRFTYYTGVTRGFLARPVFQTMQHMEQGNIALIVPRKIDIAMGWNHVFCTNGLMTHHALSLKEGNYLFPLWLKPHGTETRAIPNIEPALVQRVSKLIGLSWNDGIGNESQGELAPGMRHRKPVQELLFDQRGRGDLEKSFGPRDIFDWIYAALHSPAYRARYADLLKSDFARIPLPRAKELFRELVPLGTKLVALHLVDEIDEKALKDPKDIRFAGRGAASVEKGFPKWSNGRVAINAEGWFEEVPENVWSFHIGGYQVCEKWLKDRRVNKLGRPLNENETLHYRRIVKAISETIDLMAEIDRVIDRHGGWPGAFKGMN